MTYLANRAFPNLISHSRDNLQKGPPNKTGLVQKCIFYAIESCFLFFVIILKNRTLAVNSGQILINFASELKNFPMIDSMGI